MNPLDRLLQSLTNIKPNAEQVYSIERVREEARELAEAIARNAPDSREKSLAYTHLEETVMWAVKAIVMEDPS